MGKDLMLTFIWEESWTDAEELFDDMKLEEYTLSELHNMDSQMNNARLDISRELRRRGE